MKTIRFILLHTLLLGLIVSCGMLDGNSGDPDDDDGEVRLPTTIYPQPYSQPSVSPDGSKLVFIRTYFTNLRSPMINPDSSGIWMSDINGKNMKLLIQSLNIGTPSFSPDMKWLLFVWGAQIYKVPFSGDSVAMDGLVQLTTGGRNFFPDWSPDGEWIVYDSNNQSATGLIFIWKMKNDGSQKQRIIYTPEQGEARMPSFSPNNNNIAYIQYLVDAYSSEIFSFNLNGDISTRITENDITDRYPKYSPNGNTIAVQSNTQIRTMNADGSNINQLTEDGGREPSWTPDGRIVYVKYWGYTYDINNGTIWIMNADGSEKRQLTFNTGIELEGN